MNGVLGMAELLLMTNLDEHQVRQVKMLKNSGDSLLKIINDILDYSKIEAGKLTLENRIFELRDMVGEVVEMFADKARRKGLGLTYVIQKDAPRFVSGDDVRLRQILVNLLGNAVKFTEQGQIMLLVNMLEDGDEDLQLEFVVTDTGIGISPEAQQNVFCEFSQADSTTTRRFGGTGLGLTIVKSLCQLMNGDIHMESMPNSGSTFLFTIRCGKAFPEEFGPSCRSSVQNNPYHFAADILLVEDAPVNLEVGIGMLEALGCRVDTARHGREALEAIAKKRYDVVFMDCQMPVLDGYEATRRLRGLERRQAKQVSHDSSDKRLTIIALTAHAMQGEKQICLDAGMDDYLSKPFCLSEIGEVLSRWLPVVDSSVFEKTPDMVISESSAPPEPAVRAPGANSIDTAFLEAIRSLQRPGKPDILAKVIGQYFEDAVRQIEIIRGGYAFGDPVAMKGASHRMKSSSANLGALRLADLCKELEEICRDGGWPTDMNLITGIEQEYAEARARLEMYTAERT